MNGERRKDGERQEQNKHVGQGQNKYEIAVEAKGWWGLTDC